MPRGRNPNREKAKEMYLNAKGNVKLIDIAVELNVLDTQIRKWKSQDKWDGELKGTLPNSKRNATKQKDTKRNEGRESISEVVKEVMENDKLTDKQKLFCIYYSKCFNQTKAYQKAYDCSYELAAKNAYRLMGNEGIKAQINELTQITMNKEILKRGLIQKYIDIAFVDIRDYMSFGTETIETQKGEFEISVVKLKDSAGVDGTLISEVSQGKDGIKIKLADKMKAMDFLSKHTNLLNDDEKAKLELEYMQLKNNKLSIENKKATGEDLEIEDTEELENEIYGGN